MKMKLQHRFVEFIPDKLEGNILYISIEHSTAIHKCVCGCNNEVVTPLSPTDWELTFDGESVSLSPSIGNWGFECKSHYWIVKSKIKMARRWSEDEIQSSKRNNKSKGRSLWNRLGKYIRTFL